MHINVRLRHIGRRQPHRCERKNSDAGGTLFVYVIIDDVVPLIIISLEQMHIWFDPRTKIQSI